MVKHKINAKQADRVYALSWLVYCCSYFGRHNFSAAVAGIVAEGLFTKPQIGVVGTVFFIVYGCGQLINGFLGDRFSPYKMIFTGTLISSFANLAMCFAQNLPEMCVVWGVNGFAQSMLWSPIIYIMSNLFCGQRLVKAEVRMSATIPAGTLSAYAMSTLVMRFLGWRSVFAVAAVVLFAICVAWCINALRLGKEGRQIEPVFKSASGSDARAPFFKVAAASGFLLMVLPVMLHATLKDGVMTWVPTMITELFSVTPSFSVLITLVIPIINFFGAIIVSKVFQKGKLSEPRIACAFFAFTLLPLTALLFIKNFTPFVSVVLLALITSSMFAINHIFLTLVPVCFASCGRAATMAGLFDCVAYAGSAVSSYGFGKLSEQLGWQKTIAAWLVIAATALVFCIFAIRRWEQFKKKTLSKSLQSENCANS